MIKVLIVEDDPMVAKINQGYLQSVKGFTCAGIVQNVTDGLAFLEKTTVDLILLDIFMPGQSGLELLADIREKDKSIDVIVISAASDIQNIQTALRRGAVDYLIKPFEFERFNTALKTYQKEHRIMKEQERLNQEELDKLFLGEDKFEKGALELPKGLTRATLKRTVDCVTEMENQPFSTEGLANKVGISRVSMRKYLKFLMEIECITEDLDYGTTGRPVYKYHLNPTRIKRVTPYIQAVDK